MPVAFLRFRLGPVPQWPLVIQVDLSPYPSAYGLFITLHGFRGFAPCA